MGSHAKNTIKAGGSTAHAQNVDWTGWVSGYPLDCYDYYSTYGANKVLSTKQGTKYN